VYHLLKKVEKALIVIIVLFRVILLLLVLVRVVMTTTTLITEKKNVYNAIENEEIENCERSVTVRTTRLFMSTAVLIYYALLEC
jgi:hypothetical protein